jgi:hypothetical protein
VPEQLKRKGGGEKVVRGKSGSEVGIASGSADHTSDGAGSVSKLGGLTQDRKAKPKH